MTKPTLKAKRRYVAGDVLPDGTLVETLYNPHNQTTAFLVGHEHYQAVKSVVKLPNGTELHPISSENNLIRHGVLLLPSATKEYGDSDVLLWSIEAYIRRYCDLPDEFTKTAAAYVMLSWVYDRFNELPYLRLSGTFGTGKTRFLLTVGSIAYRPIFASGASTVSPLFHSLNDYRGTLVLDEADFRFSDEKADITKILNNGNVKGIPILRCTKTKDGEFNPEAFNVFGPKIVATRGHYQDPALESRFISQAVYPKTVKDGIPVNMPKAQAEDAEDLRNQLLLFRFRNWHRTDINPDVVGPELTGRVGQIFRPLLSVIRSKDDRIIVANYASASHQRVEDSRNNRIEVRVAKALLTLSKSKPVISLKALNAELEDTFGLSVSGRALGHVLRSKLGLTTSKRGGLYVISSLSKPEVERIAEVMGIDTRAGTPEPKGRDAHSPETSPTSPTSR